MGKRKSSCVGIEAVFRQTTYFRILPHFYANLTQRYLHQTRWVVVAELRQADYFEILPYIYTYNG